MYLEHFDLAELPFSLSPDPDFWIDLPRYREALDALCGALEEGEGFVQVLGEVGTGKSMLCRQLLARIANAFSTAYVPNPELGPRELLWTIATELDLDAPEQESNARLRARVVDEALARARRGRPLVLVVDEAQAMPHETLEALRLLTNVEGEKQRLLQVAMFAQPELELHLARHHLRQLRQRFTLALRLEPMDWCDVHVYLESRLLNAGRSEPDLFSVPAVSAIARASRGVPRLVNVLAHKALVCACGDDARQVQGRHVRAAVLDTPDARPSRLQRVSRGLRGWRAAT